MKRGTVIALGALAAALVWWWWPTPAPGPSLAPAAAAVDPAPALADDDAGAAVLTRPDAGAEAVAETRLEVRVVEEETGAAIASARVVLLTSSAVIPDTPFRVREWQTDAHGVARVELGPEGALQAIAEGHVWSLPAEGAQLAAPVVTLRCRRGTKVAGQVVNARGSPLEGIGVTAENTELRGPVDRPPRATFDRTRTDAAGRFQLWLLDGEALVRAGSGLWQVSEAEVAVPSAPLRLVLKPGFGVRGQVVGADGGAAAFAEVDYGSVRPALADEQGRFELGALDAPSATLWATSEDGEEKSAEVKAALRAGTWGDVTLQLERTLRLEGVVKDAAGRPLAGVFLASEPVGDDGDALAMTVTDWTGGSELRSGPQGEFSIDSRGLDPKVVLEVLAWAPGVEGSTRGRAGERVEVVVHQTPMVRGVVTGPDGRALTRFRLAGTGVESADGTFAVARSTLGRQLALGADGHQTASFPLPDGGVDLGRLSLAQVHRVQLELTVDGHPPRNVAIDGEQLSRERDGGLSFEARLPSQVVWLHGVEFVSKRLEVGSNDQLLRLELSSGGQLLVRTEPPLGYGAHFALEACAPQQPPVDDTRYGVPADGGSLIRGLTAGLCRLTLKDPSFEGSVMADLPGEGTAEVTMPLTLKAKPPGPTIMPHLRGPRPGRPHRTTE